MRNIYLENVEKIKEKSHIRLKKFQKNFGKICKS